MYKNLQRIVLIAGLVFGGWLIHLINAGQKEQGIRSKLIEADTRMEEVEKLASSSGKEKSSNLELKEFSRVEVKDGKTVWEVKAGEAKFSSEPGLTYIQDVQVKIARQPEGFVSISSDGARLALEGDSMQKADLEGNILVTIDDSMGLKADFATFDSVGRKFLVPGEVSIYGEGYEVRGEGFEMNVDGKKFTLRKNVRTRFTPGASLPGNLKELAG